MPGRGAVVLRIALGPIRCSRVPEEPTMHRRLVVAILALALSSQALAAEQHKLPAKPKAPKRATFDTYWGEKVRDDYQYMEKMSDPKVSAWAKAQDSYTRRWLDNHP